MDLKKKQEIIEKFSTSLTNQRIEKIINVSAQRTNHVVAVLEDIFQAHNSSAVLRSAECMGIQDVYVIEQRFKFELFESVSKGAGKWLNIKRFNKKGENNTQICFDELKSKGYKIAVTTPGKNDIVINQLPIDQKVAIVFGTEQEGLSNYALENADYKIKIPMYGFTESFNISVCAGITFYDVINKVKSSNVDWQLSQEELVDLRLDWLSKSTSYGPEIIKLLKEEK